MVTHGRQGHLTLLVTLPRTWRGNSVTVRGPRCSGTVIRVIQVLLRHRKLDTTALYAQVATELLREVISPLEAVR